VRVRASPNVISQRLRELTGNGVIRHRDLGPPARVRVYELTDWGRELEPVVLHLGQWGTRAPLPEGARWGLDSLLLTLQATADPAVVNGRYELRVGTDVFTADGTSGPGHDRWIMSEGARRVDDRITRR